MQISSSQAITCCLAVVALFAGGKQSGRAPIDRPPQAGRDPIDRVDGDSTAVAAGAHEGLRGFLLPHVDELQFYALLPRLEVDGGTALEWSRKGPFLPSMIALEVAVRDGVVTQTWTKPGKLDAMSIPNPPELTASERRALRNEVLHARLAALEATNVRLAQIVEDLEHSVDGLAGRLEALEQAR